MSKVLIIIFLLLPSALYSQQPNERYTPLVRAVYKTMPSTVIIASNSFNVEELGDFKVRLNKEVNYLGSGIVVDESGLILTNEHVIRDKKSLRVIAFDKKEYDARVIFSNAKDDLALLAIDKPGKKKFVPIVFAWPNDLFLAEPVATIGSPAGLVFSVSQGILSSTKRRLEVNAKLLFDDLIQTDIKVNPGNSGGPLINMSGDMIGMMVGSQSKSQGIGFAIPVAKIEKVLNSWLSPERISHSEIGFKVFTEFDSKKSTGRVVVGEVKKGQLNSLLGIQSGQIISQVGSVKIKTAFDFYRSISPAKPGQDFLLTVDGKAIRMKMFPLKGLTLAKARLGLEFQRLGPEMAKEISLPFHKGFLLSNVDESFKNLKIQRGDMLFKLGDKRILNDADLREALSGIKSGETVKVVFLRVVLNDSGGFIEAINDEITIPLSN